MVLNDTKSGKFIGEDRNGNKFYETDSPDEIHLRTRWVEYLNLSRPDISQVEPGWHFWLGYGTDTPPNALKDGDSLKAVRGYPLPQHHQPNLTGTDGAYIPYNTAKPKCEAWTPKVTERVEA